MGLKRHFVESLREGNRFEDVFLVTSKKVATTRAGSTYLRLKLADKTGQIDAVKWDATDEDIARFNENDYVLARATVNIYNGGPQLQLDSIKRWSEPVDAADFIRRSSRDPDEMMAELSRLLATVRNPPLAQLLRQFFGKAEFTNRFREAPAAKSVHHACVGGLLEHTLNVVKTCAALADLYPQADRDLLVAGAALHDIGKVEEYTWAGPINRSTAGNLIGHIVIGAMMVKEAANEIEGFDPLLGLALQHMLLSHHGTREFGSPKLPKSIEAVILHHADDLDAKAGMFAEAIREAENRGETGLFTDRHYFLDRPLFKGLPGDQSDEDEEETAEADLDEFTIDPFAEE